MQGGRDGALLPLLYLFLNSRARGRRHDGWQRREAAAHRRRTLRAMHRHRQQQIIMLSLLRRNTFKVRRKRDIHSSHFSFLDDVRSSEWLAQFRMSKDTFAYLCDKLRSHLYRPGPTPEEKVAIALWRLSCQSRSQMFSRKFTIGQKIISTCVKEVCQAVVTSIKSEYLLPPSSHNLKAEVHTFNACWGFPHCAGALASFNIPLKSASPNSSSSVLHAAVDGQGLIREVCIFYPESMNDATILENSFLCELAKDGRLQADSDINVLGNVHNYFFIGDSNYPLKKWLLTPYRKDRQGPEETLYNLKLERARSVAEIALLRLRARWQILLAPPSYVKVPTMALACCVLHNMCDILEQKFDARWLEEVESVCMPIQTSLTRSVFPADPQAESIREAVCKYFQSQPGVNNYSETIMNN